MDDYHHMAEHFLRRDTEGEKGVAIEIILRY